MASPRDRSGGFTLIELLIVIGIIAVLAGLITTSVTIVRQRAKKANAATAIASLKVALGAYNQKTGIYPGASTGPEDNPEVLFRALYVRDVRHGGSGENHLEDWSPSDMGIWGGAYQTEAEAAYRTPTEQELDTPSTRVVLLDPWGHPFHYVEWKSHPRSRRQLPGGQLRAKGDLPFMIWSNGPNGLNDWGQEDDITSWRGSGN